MKILAVILAKSDSNRLKNKYMRMIGNKTLLQVAVEYAKYILKNKIVKLSHI